MIVTEFEAERAKALGAEVRKRGSPPYLLCQFCHGDGSNSRPFGTDCIMRRHPPAWEIVSWPDTDLVKLARDVIDAFWGWEACDLAAQTDPEEVEDAESLWKDFVEKMSRLTAVERWTRSSGGTAS